MSKLLVPQTEFFKNGHPTLAEIQEFKRIGGRIRELFAELEKTKAAFPHFTRCAAAIFRRDAADIVRLGIAFAWPLTFAQRAL